MDIQETTVRLSIASNALFVSGSLLYVISAIISEWPLAIHINVFASFIFIVNGILDCYVALYQPVGPAGVSSADLLSTNNSSSSTRYKPHYGYLLGGSLFVLGSSFYAWNALVVWWDPLYDNPSTLFIVDALASHTFILDSIVYILASTPKGASPWTHRPRELDYWGDLLFFGGSLIYGLDSWICSPYWPFLHFACQPVSFFAAWLFLIDSLIYAWAKWVEVKERELGGGRSPGGAASVTGTGAGGESGELLGTERETGWQEEHPDDV